MTKRRKTTKRNRNKGMIFANAVEFTVLIVKIAGKGIESKRRNMQRRRDKRTEIGWRRSSLRKSVDLIARSPNSKGKTLVAIVVLHISSFGI